MLQNLMLALQEYLLLNDDEEHGSQKSLELVNKTANLRDDNMICIWLQEFFLLIAVIRVPRKCLKFA